MWDKGILLAVDASCFADAAAVSAGIPAKRCDLIVLGSHGRTGLDRIL
jgi:nucleotide-binding universal stress UspA family protein